MVLAQEPRRPPGSRARPHRAPTRPRPLGAAEGGPGADEATRAAALRRIVAEVSSSQDLDRLFQEVIDASFTLFGADRAGLWIYDDSPAPLTLAAQRGLSSAMLALIASLPRDAQTVGMTAIRERHVTILAGELEGTVPRLQRMYRAEGIRSMCFVPIVFRDEVLGLLVLYHRTDYEWSDDETDLARSFGDHIAVAMQNARLAESSRALAERLGAISELAVRLNRIHDIDGIAASIVGEAGRLIDHDTIRVYRVDHAAGVCEPIAFQGTFLGSSDPDPETLRVAIGEGLTGWVAENNQTVRSGDAGADPRGVVMGSNAEPESMLIVPMAFEDVVHGVVVVSKRGRDRFDADDETTFGIFAELRRPGPGQRLERRPAPAPAGRAAPPAGQPAAAPRGQRAAALDPRAQQRPGPDRRLAQGHRPVRHADHLPRRPRRRGPPRGHRPRPVRRPDPGPREPARRRDQRLGRRPRRGGPGQRGAHRPALRPGARDPVRAGVDDRRPAAHRRRGHRHAQHRPDGRGGGVLQRQRVRPDQALRRPGVDRPAERRDPRRGPRPRRARRPHRDPQPRRLPGATSAMPCGPAGAAGRSRS